MPLPKHGELKCVLCKQFFKEYDNCGVWNVWRTKNVRLVNNPCSWGSASPAIAILGFSKGRTQNEALGLVHQGQLRFDDVAFFERDYGNRKNLTMRKKLQKILIGAGIVRSDFRNIDKLFKPSELRFHMGSLVRCSLSVNDGQGRFTEKMETIISKARVQNSLVGKIISVCAKKHLLSLKPGSFVIMIGLKPEYIALCRNIFEGLFEVKAITLNNCETTYAVNDIVFAHVAHLSARLTDNQFNNWVEGKTKNNKMGWFKNAWLFHNNNNNRKTLNVSKKQ